MKKVVFVFTAALFLLASCSEQAGGEGLVASSPTENSATAPSQSLSSLPRETSATAPPSQPTEASSQPPTSPPSETSATAPLQPTEESEAPVSASSEVPSESNPSESTASPQADDPVNHLPFPDFDIMEDYKGLDEVRSDMSMLDEADYGGYWVTEDKTLHIYTVNEEKVRQEVETFLPEEYSVEYVPTKYSLETLHRVYSFLFENETYYGINQVNFKGYQNRIDLDIVSKEQKIPARVQRFLEEDPDAGCVTINFTDQEFVEAGNTA